MRNGKSRTRVRGGTIRPMEALVIIVAAIAIGVVVFKAVKARARELNESWGLAAEKLGLSLKPAAWNVSPRLDGDIEGYALTVDVHKRGSGQHSTTWTRFRLGVPSLPPGIELKQEGFLSGLTKVFGVQDIEVGDAAFDDKVVVKGHSETAVRTFLTPARRVRIRRFFDAYRGAVIDGSGIGWSSQGRMKDSSRLLGTVREMLRLARSLAGDEQQDRPLEEAMQAQRDGMLDEAMSILKHGRPSEDPVVLLNDSPPLDEQLLEGNLLYLSDRREEAGKIFRQALEASPDDREARGWATLAAATAATAAATAVTAAAADLTPAMPPSPPEAPVQSMAATTADETGPETTSARSLDVAAFCSAVFVPGGLSFEATRVFEADYQGMRVVWSGTLKSAEPYRYDFVFGSGAGVKATLVIHTAEVTAFGDGEVKAVIQLPEGTADLASRKGERLTFSGTLLKVDGFMRNVFVRDASLQ